MPKSKTKSRAAADSKNGDLTAAPLADLMGRFFWARRGNEQRQLVFILGDGVMAGWLRVRAFLTTRRTWGREFLTTTAALLAAPDPQLDRSEIQAAMMAADSELTAAIKRATTIEA